ncbi:hypothetical protein [Lelliottia amnigena]|uniref:hypothetical protein n=1 Tax=Lelliottia amnigena TaxID=61646 RepID=UPI00293BF1CF|nr:hypothetical protein [Lelliottia amnigena]
MQPPIRWVAFNTLSGRAALADPGARNTNACSGDRRKYNSLLRVLYDITNNPLAHASSTSIFAPQTGIARTARGSGQ